MSIKFIIPIIVLVLISTTISAEPTAQTFVYQGKIEKNETPINGVIEVTMGLFPVDTGGSVLSSWVRVVTVTDGSFSFDYAIQNNELDGDQRWLEIWVRETPGSGSWSVLSPRQPIRPAPYAIHALNGSNESIWTVDGSSIYYNDGNVGIGTANPTEKLSVVGSVQLSSNSSFKGSNGGLGFLNNLGDGGGGAQLGNAGSIDFILDLDNNDSTRNLRIMSDGTNRSSATTLLSVLETGNVGIGTTDPQSKFQVIGGLDAGLDTDGYLQLGPSVGNNIVMDTNEIMARNNGAISHLYLNHDGGHVVIADNGFGRLGIGTETPDEALHVVGTTLTLGIRMPTGSESGYLLTSDTNGVASWQAPAQSIWSTNGPSVYYNGGMVGIGTDNPIRILDLNNAGGGIGLRMRSGGGWSAELVQSSQNILSLKNGGLERLNVLYDGKIGIGTMGPVTKFQIHDATSPTIRLSGTANNPPNAGSIEFSESRDQEFGNFQIVYDGSANKLKFNTWEGADIRERLTLVRSTGRLGVGESDPAVPLHVNGGTSLTLAGGGYLQLGRTASANLVLSDRAIQSRILGLAGPLLLNYEGGDIYMMRNGEGKVGIGTNSPQNRLDVQGAGASTGGLASPETMARFKQTAAGNEHTAISVDALENQDSIIYFAENGAATWDIRNNEDYESTGSSYDRFQIAYRKGGVDDMTLTIRPQAIDYLMTFIGTFEIDGHIEVNGDVYPASDNGGSLGSDSRTWSAVWAQSGIVSTSDIRMKQDIVDINDGLGSVMSLHPVSYHWKSDPEGKMNPGLIAQEVFEVIPEVVEVPDDPEIMMGINYGKLIPVLIRAIQQQQTQIDAQAALIEELMDRTAISADGFAKN